MKEIKYAPSTANDLRWYHRYYTKIFPAGRSNARQNILNAEKTLITLNHAGKEIKAGLYSYSIPKTPFAFEYIVDEKRGFIIIKRLRDTRGYR